MSVDKETQMTPQKANTPLREIMTKKTEGTVIRSVKTGSKKKRKRKFIENAKARLHPPELGMTEEEMLRRGPMCKDCHKGHFGQVCSCNKCGWIHPHHGCLDRPFTLEEIPTITEIPPEYSPIKEISLTVPIKGEHWCWLCKSHGPEKICPRKDEIDTEYGRQGLKELLQEMVKPQERLGVELDSNGVIPEVNQETPSYSIQKGEPIGPKIVQLLQDKKPHIKPVEFRGGAQWPSKPTTTTSSKSLGSVVGQSPTKWRQKPTAGRDGTRDDQEEEQFLPRPPLRGNGGGGDGGDGNGGGGDDDGDDDDDEGDDDEEDEDDKDTETVTESENGEKQNAPGGGGGGGDEPSSNPRGGNVGPRGKRGHRGQRG